MVLTGTSGSSCGGQFSFYKNGTNVKSGINGGGASMDLIHTFGTLTATDVIKMNYTGSSSSTCAITFKLKMVGVGEKIADNSCNNLGEDTQIVLNNDKYFTFNLNKNLPAYVGYMYGTVYTSNNEVASNGAYFGNSFTWDGTNYKLVDTSTTKDNTHHYTCNLGTADGTCTILRYYYYQNYYVNLTGGDGIEEALTKMQTNTNNSNAKDKIDTWYASNMTSYTNKLEDTIWCNDRSFGDGNNNGWIANGGSWLSYLYYGATQRSNYAMTGSTVKNQPSLACANKNDSFTVSNANGNGALTYPVALLTEDEVVLAGGLVGSATTAFYLSNGSYFWSLSPDYFYGDYASEFFVNYGYMSYKDVDDTAGLRPAISLKQGTVVAGGTGTALNPYVIE